MTHELKLIEGGADIPEEPSWHEIYPSARLSAVAARYWREVVSEMKAVGTLAPVNGHAIRRIVQVRIEFDGAMEDVIAQGRLATTGRRQKGAPTNANWGCAKQAAELLSHLEAELGLSPRRRGAASKVSRARKRESANDYLMLT